MRSRRGLKPETFPFLAVLLCAMGSLILLLLVMDRRARTVVRARALQAAARAASAESQAEAAQREEWQRRCRALHTALLQQDEEVQGQARSVQEQLQAVDGSAREVVAQRQELEQRIQQEQLRLAGLEKDLSVRKGQAARAEEQTAAARAEAANLARDLEQLEQTLADLRALRQRQQHTYSVVPYRGKHGESRHPLYLECTSTGLIFHPDHKQLLATPGEAPAIRAEVEQRTTAQREALQAAGVKEEKPPYVLFLIRPDGIASYYRILAALDGLRLDFGYEFIDADWLLDFAEDGQTPLGQPWQTTAAPAAPPQTSPSRPEARRTGPPRGVAFNQNQPGLPGAGPGTQGPGPGGDGAGTGALPGAEVGGGALAGGGSPGSGSPGGGPAGSAFGVPGASGSGPRPGLVSGTPGSVSGPDGGVRTGGLPGAGAGGGEFAGVGSPGVTGLSGLPGAGGGGGEPAGVGASEASGASGGGSPGSGFGPPGFGNGQGASPANGTPGITSGPGASPGPGALAGAGQGAGSGKEGLSGGPTSSSGVEEAGSGGSPLLTASRKATLGESADSEGAGSGSFSGATQSTAGAAAGSRGGSPGSAGGSGGGGEGRTAAEAGPPAPFHTGTGGEGTSTSEGAPASPFPATGQQKASGSAPSSGQSGQAGTSAEPTEEGEQPGRPSLSLPSISGTDRKPPADPLPPRRARFISNRDWFILVECRADALTVYPGGQRWEPSRLTTVPEDGKTLIQTVQRLITRRQATVRPGEPPYRPQVRFLVRPDGLRTFYTAYPLLETLQLPMSRQNLDQDEEIK